MLESRENSKRLRLFALAISFMIWTAGCVLILSSFDISSLDWENQVILVLGWTISGVLLAVQVVE